jgi:peptide/nickel transport system permease protein
MAAQPKEEHEQIRKTLRRLDLHHHSLKYVGQKLAAEAAKPPPAWSGALHDRSLRLSKDCLSVLQDLCDHVEKEDVASCQSALKRIDLAVKRASNAETHASYTASIWRVVDANERFLTSAAEKYGYVTLSERIELEPVGVQEGRADELAEPSAVYEKAVRAEMDFSRPAAIPSFRALPRWRAGRLLSRPGLVLGILIVLAFASLAIAAPVIAPAEGEDPYIMPKDGYHHEPRPPSADHLLGTMQDQYDVLHGLVWGTRVAFKIGLSVTLGRALIGILLGLVSGYYGRLPDAVIMRVTDAFLAFPIVPATMLMLAFFAYSTYARRIIGGGVQPTLLLTLILFGWMQYARLVRGNVLAEREKQYVEAAIAIGARSPRIMFRHVLPNVPQGLFVLIASDVGAMVVLAAVFTFLGLGGERGLADWGWMLNVSRNWIVGTPSNAFKYWYTYLPPSMAIVLFSMGWNLVGDGLRDVLDPRLRFAG